ncbi:helix-turn-helix domain-containing protein [Sphingopyxis sp. JAI128]|uniref:helix-turn-helix domain-containing protein n=1 Tax=Sphingopyxis sp. JAI128 TaxID=2723066 RepID=UPI001833C998|nr:helix-turn-helix domain-containing protein [Sphingopyxis sp. JAI128]MBB6427030.1 tetratricopeptide (TPR) repeat protein [Sphingopyxis sp. JAI128]
MSDISGANDSQDAAAVAAQLLAAGAPFDALQLVALREDAAALALRGIALAQIGDLERGIELLRRARARFADADKLAKARCILAEAEIRLALRDFRTASRLLAGLAGAFGDLQDRFNAAHAVLLEARLLMLTGRIGEAGQRLDTEMPLIMPASLRAAHLLLRAEIAARRARAQEAALLLADAVALAGDHAMLRAQAAALGEALERPVARTAGGRLLVLREVEELLASGALVLDLGRQVLGCDGIHVDFTGRPILLMLLQMLAEQCPSDVTRDTLVQRVFGAREVDEGYRNRLRVEMSRLRRHVGGTAAVRSTARGYRLVPLRGGDVVVLSPPIASPEARLLGLLSDGEAWSSFALAAALGASQRSVQRGLAALMREGQAGPVGDGRLRRWVARPLAGVTPNLLLVAATGTGDTKDMR